MRGVCNHCGHPERDHRANGACVAVVTGGRFGDVVCPCNNYDDGGIT